MDHKERNATWVSVSVPQFGDWDKKGVIADYSMDFSKMREMRKQNKEDPSSRARARARARASIGNEEEDLISISSTTSSTSAHNHLHTYKYNPNHSPTGRRRSFFSYFNCCVKA